MRPDEWRTALRYYQKEQKPDGRIIYEAWDADRKMSTFSYRITEEGRFFVEEVRLSYGVDADPVFRAVIQFLEYKAGVSVNGPVYVRIDQKNHYLIRHYLDHGFYSIDTEETVDAYGRECKIMIMRNR